jgi:small subunit ribosomal protein S20
MAEEEKKLKKKVPTALKRNKQDEKKEGVNRILKSRIRTSIRSFNDHLKEKNQETLTKDLNNIYALVDKAVKKNIYKVNKAKRVKSHYAKYMQQAIAS